MANQTIPESHLELFERPVIGNLATLLPDGMIQVNPVWVDYDGRYVRFNSAQGRQKDKNLKKNGIATMLLVDPENAYYWIEIRGCVVEITNEGADAHIDSLAKKYLGADSYPFRKASEVRLTYKIQPERVNAFGPQR
ncbi:MAG: PPOX class F420-dependent oxidoreductase [Anaerolineae bacterium]|nr:PPOX class F420-dependent oxidoreductase [Anaerolineae bacterium]